MQGEPLPDCPVLTGTHMPAMQGGVLFESIRADRDALAAIVERVRDVLDDSYIDQRTGVDVGMRVLAAIGDPDEEET